MHHPTCISWPPHPTPCCYHGSHLVPGLLVTSSSMRSPGPLPEKWSLGPALVSQKLLLLVLLLPCCHFPLYSLGHTKCLADSNCVFGAVPWEQEAPFLTTSKSLFYGGAVKLDTSQNSQQSNNFNNGIARIFLSAVWLPDSYQFFLEKDIFQSKLANFDTVLSLSNLKNDKSAGFARLPPAMALIIRFHRIGLEAKWFPIIHTGESAWDGE